MQQPRRKYTYKLKNLQYRGLCVGRRCKKVLCIVRVLMIHERLYKEKYQLIESC